MARNKFWTRQRRIFIFKWILFPVVMFHLSFGLTAAIRNSSMKHSQFAAILISDHITVRPNTWLGQIIFFAAYPYWTTYFNNRGLTVRWVLHARAYHLETFIVNRYYQSILLVGRGDASSWYATDKRVTHLDVMKMSAGTPRKQGEWLQLTDSPAGSNVSMGELVVHDYHAHVYPVPQPFYILLLDTFLGFKTLKATHL